MARIAMSRTDTDTDIPTSLINREIIVYNWTSPVVRIAISRTDTDTDIPTSSVADPVGSEPIGRIRSRIRSNCPDPVPTIKSHETNEIYLIS